MMIPENEKHTLQKHLVNFLVHDVFNGVDENDILQVIGPNVWLHKGHRLTDGQVKALREEARTFKETGLWKILSAELLWLGQQACGAKSKTESDLIAGKNLMYTVEVINKRLDKMIVV